MFGVAAYTISFWIAKPIQGDAPNLVNVGRKLTDVSNVPVVAFHHPSRPSAFVGQNELIA